jgi:hypothetical protein
MMRSSCPGGYCRPLRIMLAPLAGKDKRRRDLPLYLCIAPEGVTSFSIMPLKVASYFGLILAFLSGLYGTSSGPWSSAPTCRAIQA